MRAKVKEKVMTQSIEKTCRHYWIIEIANGPVSRGKCKYCGERKEFMNFFPEFNPIKKNANPLSLPRLPVVKVDEDSKS